MKYANILAASKADGIAPIIPGLASETEGWLLTSEQMDNIDAELAANAAAIGQLQTQLDTATEMAVESSNGLTAANEELAAQRAATEELQTRLDASEAALAAAQQRIAQLESGDATRGADAAAGADPNRGNDADKFLTSYDLEKRKLKAKLA